MKLWTIAYTRIPTNYNSQQVAKIEAETAEDATALLNDCLGETARSLRDYVLQEPREYVAPAVAGRVVSLSGGEQ